MLDESSKFIKAKLLTVEIMHVLPFILSLNLNAHFIVQLARSARQNKCFYKIV